MNDPDDANSAIKHALKNIFNDPCWRIRPIRSKWHRFAEIKGIKTGVVLATNNKPEYDSVALNCAHLERLRNARAVGKVDRGFVVAAMTNGAGQLEYRGHADAEVLFEKLRHQTPINGTYGPFWSLRPDEFEIDEDEPF